VIEIIWTYRVRQERLCDFERYYRSDGVWAQLFRNAAAYRGTVLLHDSEDPLRFATIDRWESLAGCEEFLKQHRAEYERIDAVCAAFTTEETRVGSFEPMSEGENA
jgi:heme-degrading monooxygenase HmoA